jgi:hypothetical protein
MASAIMPLMAEVDRRGAFASSISATSRTKTHPLYHPHLLMLPATHVKARMWRALFLLTVR